MAKEKLTLTLDAEQVAALRELVGARSLSAGVDAAVAAYVTRMRHLAAVEEWLAEMERAGMRRSRVEVRDVDARVGVRAGQLLGRVRAGSELAVDAFVVAVADLAGGAVVATGDPEDLERLAVHATRVTIADAT